MFILSSNYRLEPELSNFDRLYAYPNIPIITNENTIILDSGAFALSKKKQKMDEAYMQKLSEHYKWYIKHDNVYFVAPDVFKSPILSMKQFLYFQSICDVDVAPVIQFAEPNVDLFWAKKQIDFYRKLCKPRMICVSNHKFNIVQEKENMELLVEMIKESFGNLVKIHVLGAGFNSLNVAQWMNTGVTSMDSVSYYSDAPKHKWQFGTASLEASHEPFKPTALHNAKVAIESAKNYKVII